MSNKMNLKVLTSLTILILIPSLFGCVESSLCEEIESLRKSSGDKRVEFVLVKKSCGATTSNSEMLYIVQTGMDVDDQHPEDDVSIWRYKHKGNMVSYRKDSPVIRLFLAQINLYVWVGLDLIALAEYMSFHSHQL